MGCKGAPGAPGEIKARRVTNREYYREEIKEYAKNNMILAFIQKHNIIDTREVSIYSELALFMLWLDEVYKPQELKGRNEV